MPVLVDFHVLAQALLYFFSAVCGLVVSIPLGVTTVNFKGNCLLYTECHWANATFFTADFSSQNICNFPVYLTVFAGILYAVAMGCYYIYAVTRKDPNIGAQMWVLPFTLVSSLVATSFFVSACVISVGFKDFCDSYLKGKENFGRPDTSCADAQNIKWHYLNDPKQSFDGSTFYAYIHASQGASWVMFLAWAVQVGLGIARIIRNRRLRSQGMYEDSNDSAPGVAGGGGKKPEDMANVVAPDPSV